MAMPRRVAFRADSSLEIGSGHVMRCLTLGEGLRRAGAECIFVTREHAGHIGHVIAARGFEVLALPEGAAGYRPGPDATPHAAWLGCDWETDADQSIVLLSSFNPDLVIVDHYALDWRWEGRLRETSGQVLVLDDLADRKHRCEFLVDANLGRRRADYVGLVPADTNLMVGPAFAALRPEFAALRNHSLARRSDFRLESIQIAMGGVDQSNATCEVLRALLETGLPAGTRIEVIMGTNAPWLDAVRALAEQMPWRTSVHVGVSDMAERMAECDLAIGGAGTTSWERCCLGVPTLVVILAENQREGAAAMHKAGMIDLVGTVQDVAARLPLLIPEIMHAEVLRRMSHSARDATDGEGVARIVAALDAA